MIKTKKDSARGEGLDARARGEGRDASARGEVGEGNDNVVVVGEQPCRGGGMPMSEEHRREGVSMSEAGGQCQRSGGSMSMSERRGGSMSEKRGGCQCHGKQREVNAKKRGQNRGMPKKKEGKCQCQRKGQMPRVNIFKKSENT